MNTKEEFHRFIDTIDDEDKLKGYLRFVQLLNKQETGALWKSLNAAEQEALLMAYDESFDPANLVPHDEVKKQYAKWLRK